MTNIYYLRWP